MERLPPIWARWGNLPQISHLLLITICRISTLRLGFPVSSNLPGKGDIIQSCIPEGLSVFSVYMGPYSQMETVYSEMGEWISKNGFIPTGTVYEHYYNGPDFPESQYLTKIVMPVKKPE